MASRLFNRVTSFFTGVKLHDFNCGLKCYRRELVEELALYGELHRYIPAIANWKGFRVGEVKVGHHPRMHGESKFGSERYLRGLFDLLTVIMLTKYPEKPLHFFGLLGTILSLSGLAINLYMAILRISGKWISNRPLLLLGILLLIATFWDALIDPFIGHFSDTLRSRFGRRRPFLMFATPFILLGVILIWTPPSATNYAVNAVYFLAIILIYHTSFSLVGIPYDASLPEMAPETHDRLKLSYWKSLLGIVGVLIGSLVAAPLFETIGPVWMGVVVGVVADGRIGRQTPHAEIRAQLGRLEGCPLRPRDSGCQACGQKADQRLPRELHGVPFDHGIRKHGMSNCM